MIDNLLFRTTSRCTTQRKERDFGQRGENVNYSGLRGQRKTKKMKNKVTIWGRGGTTLNLRSWLHRVTRARGYVKVPVVQIESINPIWRRPYCARGNNSKF